MSKRTIDDVRAAVRATEDECRSPSYDSDDERAAYATGVDDALGSILSYLDIEMEHPDGAPIEEVEEVRQKLPPRRASVNHKIAHAGRSWHVTVGLDERGRPREAFAHGARAGSHMDALVDDACIVLSLLYQHGAEPVRVADRLTRVDESVIGAVARVVVRECPMAQALVTGAQAIIDSARPRKVAGTPAPPPSGTPARTAWRKKKESA